MDEPYPRARVVQSARRHARKRGYVEAPRPFLEHVRKGWKVDKGGRPYPELWVINCWGPPGERPGCGVAFHRRDEALWWAYEVWPGVRTGPGLV